MEALELIDLLSGRGIKDRLARHRLDRQGGASARVAVELGDDDAVELHDRGELLGDRDRVLTGHSVNDEQDIVGLDRFLDLGELLH